MPMVGAGTSGSPIRSFPETHRRLTEIPGISGNSRSPTEPHGVPRSVMETDGVPRTETHGDSRNPTGAPPGASPQHVQHNDVNSRPSCAGLAFISVIMSPTYGGHRAGSRTYRVVEGKRKDPQCHSVPNAEAAFRAA